MITLKVCWLQVDCLYVSVRRWRAVRVVKGWETIALGRKAFMRARLLRIIFSRVFRLWLQRVVVLTVARRRATEIAARQRAAAACVYLHLCLTRWKTHRAQV
jgi:hypothetical protein